MKKTNTRRAGVILAATTAALAMFSLVRPAAAQYQANQDGHALDASNRVGSGGYNATRGQAGGVSANNIAERNVTGLGGFHGPIGERDPRAFTGPAPSLIDAFNRVSSGAQLPGSNQQPLGQQQQYYGDDRFTAPPAGSIPLGFNGGYIGTTLNTPASLSSSFNTQPDAGSLQARTLDRETYLITQALKTPEALQTINEFNQSGTLNVSPVYGLQSINNGTGNFNPLGASDFTSDAATIMQMRDELRNTASGLNANPNNPNNPNNPAANPNGVQQPQPGQEKNPQQPTGLNQPLNQPLGQPFGSATNGPISTQVRNAPLSGTPLPQTGEIPASASEKTPLLPPAAEQSTLLATLQQRLQQSGDVGKALAAAHPPVTPQAPKPAATGTGVAAPNPSQPPVPVSTLAMGVKAKGLHDLLSGAEDLIKQGKYDSAVAEYNQALRVAPNNPLPFLGRAHAELAGGYYGRAEMDLRIVFRNDPELLLAQFDLKSLFPKDRIDFIRKDLHDVAAADPQSERPWFLLAYLDYNTGDTATADKDLNEAEQRSHGDWSVRLLRQHWALPSNPKPAPLMPRTAPPVVPPARTITPGPAPAKTPAPAAVPAPRPAPISPAPAPELNK